MCKELWIIIQVHFNFKLLFFGSGFLLLSADNGFAFPLICGLQYQALWPFCIGNIAYEYIGYNYQLGNLGTL